MGNLTLTNPVIISMSRGELHFLEQKVQELAFIFFGSGTASGMMLLKVSILCFKPFKSMSSVKNQLPPLRADTAFAFIFLHSGWLLWSAQGAVVVRASRALSTLGVL